SVLYLFTSFTVYCLYLPDEWLQRLAMFPLVFCVQLEEVMETETYKTAKLILERFDPEAKNRRGLESTPVGPQLTPRPGQGTAVSAMLLAVCGKMSYILLLFECLLSAFTFPSDIDSLSAPGGPPDKSTPSTSMLQGAVERTPCTPIRGMYSPGPPLPRPILPRERGTVDRVIEYLVGDGPEKRYALICQQCFSHNGMALKEEFEYLAFRCAYCYFLNPARKTRPQAPRLPEFSYERRLRADPCSPGPSLCFDMDAEDTAENRQDEEEEEKKEDEAVKEEEKELDQSQNEEPPAT
uniref:Endoplasmic reticulum junction formation protein lunapark n=1 Tax=Xiphophorus couchianus TaxID=32473 RepID=A0A3B5MGK1_9TELE